jgi:hypothetical protein
MRFGLKLAAWIIGLGGLLALADSISTKRAEPAAVAIIALLVFLFVWAFLRNLSGDRTIRPQRPIGRHQATGEWDR